MSRRASSRDTLWLLHRPPEPDGTREQRSAWEALSRASASGAPRVLVETPPLAWRTLQAALSGRGVELRPGWHCDEEGFLAKARTELRGRQFAAVVVSGAEAARRWLSRARMLAPAARLVCHLPDPRLLVESRPGDGPSAAAQRREAARRALSQADEVWCDDEKGLAAARAILRGGPMPAARLTPAGPSAAPVARRTEAVEVAVLGQAAGPAADAASRLLGRRARAERLEPAPGEEARAVNAALRRARAPLIWLVRAGCEADDTMLRPLAEGLALRPYAGGAVPLEAAPKAGAPAPDARWRAAWAIHRKGDWHEADHLSRHPCVLLRRDALEASGLLDERFETLDAAFMDLSLRLRQSGRPLFQARDALCAPAVARPVPPADRALLAEKWGPGALRLLESLATALEPAGYRLDPGVRAGLRGER